MHSKTVLITVLVTKSWHLSFSFLEFQVILSAEKSVKLESVHTCNELLQYLNTWILFV